MNISSIKTHGGFEANRCTRYINTNNFLRSVRNFNVDVTRTPQDAYVCGIHWQVAQGTSLENMVFYMSQDAATTQQVSISSLKLKLKNLYPNICSGSLHGKRQWWFYYQPDIRWWQFWVIPLPGTQSLLATKISQSIFWQSTIHHVRTYIH